MRAVELIETLREKFVFKRYKFVINEVKEEDDIEGWGTITITSISGNGYVIAYNYDETNTIIEIFRVLTIGTPSLLGLVEIIKTTKVDEDYE